MSPYELIASLERKQQEESARPNPDHELIREATQELKDALTEQNQKLIKILSHLSVKVENPPAEDDSKVIAAIKGLETSLKPETHDDSNVIKALKALMSQNVKLEAAITKLEVKPEVKVEAPVLNVPETDLKPVIKAIKESKPEPVTFDTSDLKTLLEQNLRATEAVATAVKKQEFRIPNTPTDPLIYYLPADIDDAGGATGVNYLGYTDNRGAWYIKKMDNSAAPKTIRFSFGQAGYSANWANRAALAYSLWGA